ncbi:hypothetical protein SH580_00420 [Coraliomargarita algicola]|uniref:Glycoside hydrolase family 5 domain-containing protein n=1 Tax=Coraliomargarita algicola TaxID=3092156 RepID=A0ABZ0RM41_9BACT|nr:hypothetical protein [Coraliomargarita sp. J2-16]WPJ96163.1 hypothetical protein SH580_00420 [Coraliomargarita sp. J2-16]
MQIENDFMLGVAARLPELTSQDLEMMRSVGIRWLRFGDFQFDAAAFMKNAPQSSGFEEACQRVQDLRDSGFQLMGLSPGPREMAKLGLTPGSDEYYEAYAAVSRFFALKFEGLIEWWQVANELDIWIFRDNLDMDQSVEFLKVGIRAMKEAVPSLKVGINITLFPSLPGEVDGNTDAHEGLILAKGIYGDPSLPVDYAGFDSYPGTWRKGGPESWHEYLDGFYALTGKPIFIQEFGYASAGGNMTPANIDAGAYPCDVKRWKFNWRGEHSEAVQAEYIKESMKIFIEKPFVIGATYYNWRDAANCWQCQEPDCPAETAWGLLNQQGLPKPSFYALESCARAIELT